MAKNIFSSLCIITVVLSFFITSAQATSAPSIKLAEKKFSERYSSNIPVSGRVLTGVTVSSQEASELSIYIPTQDRNKQICLSVMSRDGTYSSRNQYQSTEDIIGSFQSVEYPSEYQEVIAGFTEDELAMLAYPGNCDSNKISQFYLSSRGVTELSDTVTLFVSSGRSDVFLKIKDKAKKNKTVRCQRIQKGKRTGYDTLCHVKLNVLSKGVNELSLLRRKSGRMLPSVKFSIILNNEKTRKS
jgi:hypothetical protein